MSLKERLVTGVLEMGAVHAECHSPVCDVRSLIQKELVSNNARRKQLNNVYPV